MRSLQRSRTPALANTLGTDLPDVPHRDRDFDGVERASDRAGAFGGSAEPTSVPLVREAQPR